MRNSNEPGETVHANQPEPRESELWRELLRGSHPLLPSVRNFWRRIPSSPRCKFCLAPFALPGRAVASIIGHGRSSANPLLCNGCFGKLRRHPGGAEVDLSILFADVRGSTGLAERQPPAAFRKLLQAFYELSVAAIDHQDGVLDKFLGDGVMALFLPITAGADHARCAIEAGRDLLRMAGERDLPQGGLRVGAGVHAGTAFVGVLGSGDRLDFTAVGDAVNVAARLGSIAAPGELWASREAWVKAGLSVDSAAVKTVDIRGRSQAMDVVVVRVVPPE